MKEHFIANILSSHFDLAISYKETYYGNAWPKTPYPVVRIETRKMDTNPEIALCYLSY
jgi:hypothetical protein